MGLEGAWGEVEEAVHKEVCSSEVSILYSITW